MIYTQIFNFGAIDAGLPVDTQVLDADLNVLTTYAAVGVTEAGSGQFGSKFVLPAGFVGYVRGRVMTGPDTGAVDTYAVNLPQQPATVTPILTDAQQTVVTPILTDGPVTVITPEIV